MTNTTESAAVQEFETETCGRCGGSGKYSYNMMDGDRCFGCGGKGTRLTKRGKVAAAYLVALRSKAARDLKTGDVIRVSNITIGGSPFRHFATVESVEHYDNSGSRSWIGGVEQPRRDDLLTINTTSKFGGCSHSGVPPEARYETRGTSEERIATRAAALAYQATLTKTGKVRA